MGQAAAAPNTLPDPHDPAGASAPAGAVSADDLLAQLAGEEIDRLLAETDDEPAASYAQGSAAVAAPAAGPQVAAASDPITEPPVNAAASSIQAVHAMGDQLDALLKEIEAPKAAGPAQSPAEMTTIAQLGATTNNEVNALLGEEVSGNAADPIDDGSPLPVYVRALEMLNAPFAAMPGALRESLGKIAILTLFNSVAVLLYIMIFRRR